MKSAYFLLMFLVAPILFPARAEVVVVDFQRVFENYRELKRVDQRFRKSVQEFQEAQRLEVEALTEKRETFNQLRSRAAQAGVGDEERKQLADQATNLLDELRQAEQKLQSERNEFQKQLEAKGNRLRRRIVDQVTDRISDLAGQRGWSLVLDSSARGVNGLPVAHFVAPERDVTGEVLAALNADEPEVAQPEVELGEEPVDGPDE